MIEPTTRPPYVTHDDIVAVRQAQRLRHPNNPFAWKSSRKVKCCECRKDIADRDRLGFVVEGVRWMHFIHLDERTCVDNIANKKAKPNSLVIKVRPPYKPRKEGWTLSPEELAAALFIKDHRLRRLVTQCRICGKDITAPDARAAFTVKDEATGWTLRTGFTHERCRKGKESNMTEFLKMNPRIICAFKRYGSMSHIACEHLTRQGGDEQDEFGIAWGELVADGIVRATGETRNEHPVYALREMEGRAA